MPRQVNLRLDNELYARVERARGDLPRERWLRRAVEQALGEFGETEATAGSSVTSASPEPVTPAPAEQPPRSQPDRPLSSVLRPARSFVRQGSGPVPKGKG